MINQWFVSYSLYKHFLLISHRNSSTCLVMPGMNFIERLNLSNDLPVASHFLLQNDA